MTVLITGRPDIVSGLHFGQSGQSCIQHDHFTEQTRESVLLNPRVIDI